MSSNESTKKITANIILEILGRPPEHLIESLEKIIKQLGEEKGVKINSKKINEPKPFEKQEGFFTTFAEIELEVEEMFTLAILMFKYMPAHVEIVSPEKIALVNNDWNTILNELTRRLHGYDEVARVIQNEKILLEKKLREVMDKKEE